jgi:hypothetical protein
MNTPLVEPGLAEAVGLTSPIRLRIEHATVGVLAEGEIDQPFALVGSNPDCEISLNDLSLPGRAAALQVIAGRVVIFPLQTLTPTPLAADVTWKIGEFNLSWLNDHATGVPTDPLRSLGNGPRLSLERQTASGEIESIPMTRRIGFLGRASGCAVRFDSADAADVHAYIMFTGNGLWIVDLLSVSGTWLNNRMVRTARLRDGDELRIGSEALTVRYDSWGEVVPVSARSGATNEWTMPTQTATPVTSPNPPTLPVQWKPTDLTDLVPLTALGPTIPTLPALAVPSQADPNTLAMFQYVTAMQGQMMAEFRRSMDEMAGTFGRMHQQHMLAMQTELNRLADLNTELQKLQLQASAPVQTLSPASALYQHLPDPADLPGMTEESADRHHWVAARLAEIEAERGGIWDRIRGMFVKSPQQA